MGLAPSAANVIINNNNSSNDGGSRRKSKYEPIEVEESSFQDEEIIEIEEQQQHYLWKLCGSFWILGLLNNSSYVIMLACAKNISEGGTGLVFLANVIPGLTIKMSAPYWFHVVSYKSRLSVASLLMTLSFISVAMSRNIVFQLMGVAFGSAQCGLGEASLLALAGKTDATLSPSSSSASPSSSDNNSNSQRISKGQCLTSFSSGTGMAGVFGFFWKWFWNDFLLFSLETTLCLALSLSIGYWMTSRYALNQNQHRQITQQPEEYYSSNENGHSYRDETVTEETELGPISNASVDHHINQSEDADDKLVQGDNRIYNDEDEVIANNRVLKVEEMTGKQRFCLVLSLWPYMIPLFVVYAAEYALQAGTWSAMGFPLEDIQSRDQFYEFSNWMYQAGVFLSRSSGTLFTVPISVLWLMPTLQTINLIVFCFVASRPLTSPLYKPSILYAGAFYTGLLGGAVYISGYKRICADLPLVHREFALSATSVAEGLGIVVADVVGLVIQGCIYQINGLEGATLSCPISF